MQIHSPVLVTNELNRMEKNSDNVDVKLIPFFENKFCKKVNFLENIWQKIREIFEFIHKIILLKNVLLKMSLRNHKFEKGIMKNEAYTRLVLF